MKLLVFIISFIAWSLNSQSISGEFLPIKNFKWAMLYKMSPNEMSYVGGVALDSLGRFTIPLDGINAKGIYQVVYNLPVEKNNFELIHNGNEELFFTFNKSEGIKSTTSLGIQLFNTFYKESGPCIETTMNSCSATLELLLQSFNANADHDEIRVFTGLPSTWKNASFNKMRTQGGHSVSAHFKDNKTASILLTAGSNREIKLVYNGEKLPVKTSSKAKVQSSNIGDFQCITVSLKKGDTLSVGQDLIHDKFITVPAKTAEGFHFGLK